MCFRTFLSYQGRRARALPTRAHPGVKMLKARDQKRLSTCNPDQISLFGEVSKHRKCRILCGHRNERDQNTAFMEHRSKVKFPHSKHNKLPSDAVDASPDPIPDNWGRISFELIPERHRKQIKKEIKELCEFYNFNGYVEGTADQMGIKIRQGHDWDGDDEFNDQTFDDLIHTETREAEE